MATKLCPHCDQEIGETEKVCPKCNVDLDVLEEEISTVERALKVSEKRKAAAKNTPAPTPAPTPTTEPAPKKRSIFRNLNRS